MTRLEELLETMATAVYAHDEGIDLIQARSVLDSGKNVEHHGNAYLCPVCLRDYYIEQAEAHLSAITLEHLTVIRCHRMGVSVEAMQQAAETFHQAIENPPAPTPALIEMVETYGKYAQNWESINDQIIKKIAEAFSGRGHNPANYNFEYDAIESLIRIIPRFAGLADKPETEE